MICTFINSNGQSGTHLAKKCLSLLGGEYIPLATNASVGHIPFGCRADHLPSFDPFRDVLTGVNWPGVIAAEKLKQERFLPLIGPGKYGASHMLHTQTGANLFEDLDMKMLLIVRGPRDWAYSAARGMSQNPTAVGRSESTTIKEHIYDCLFGFPSTGETVGRLSILDRYKSMAQWLPYHFVLCIKFEDLVGPKGGGSLSIMKETIEEIAFHLKVTITPKLINTICQSLFGGTDTFRKGKIGTWREYEESFSSLEAKEIVKASGEYFQYAIDYESQTTNPLKFQVFGLSNWTES